MNTLKVSASTLVVDIVDQALLICGIQGYREDSQYTLGRLLRDAHGAALMVNNDRIIGNNAQLLLMQRESDDRWPRRTPRPTTSAPRCSTPGCSSPTRSTGSTTARATSRTSLQGVERYVRRSSGTTRRAPRRWFPPIMAREDVPADRLPPLVPRPDRLGPRLHTATTASTRQLLARARGGRRLDRARSTPAEVVLCSATCHPLYAAAHRRSRPAGSPLRELRLRFRHEPSLDPARMQSFRMHEFVLVGTPERGGRAPRRVARARAATAARRSASRCAATSANDPFFGRLGTHARRQPARRRRSSSRSSLRSARSRSRPRSCRPTTTATTSACPSGSSTADGETAHSSVRRLRPRPHHARAAPPPTVSTRSGGRRRSAPSCGP